MDGTNTSSALNGVAAIRSDRRPGDDELIVSLHKEGYRREGARFVDVFAPFVAETVAEAELDAPSNSRVWFAEIDGRPVGCAAMVDRAPLGQLRWVVVLDDARGLGLGRRLLACAVDHAREMGWREVYLETTDGLEASMGLYDQFGFVTTIDEVRPLWHGEGRFIEMRLQL